MRYLMTWLKSQWSWFLSIGRSSVWLFRNEPTRPSRQDDFVDLHVTQLEERVVLNADFSLATGAQLTLDNFTQSSDENLTITESGSDYQYTLSEGTWSGSNGGGVSGTGTSTLTFTKATANALSTGIRVNDNATTPIDVDVNFATVDYSGLSGALDFDGIGNVTQDGGSTVLISTVDFDAVNVTLNNSANDFGTVSFTSAVIVDINDTNALTLGVSNVSGNLTVDAGDAVALNGAISIGGDLDIEADANNANGGAISGSGAITVTGTTTLDTGTPATTDNDITLTTAGNNFGGAVSIVAANDVSLVDANALDLGTSNITNNLTATTTLGNLTDSGTVTVGGTASFTTNGEDADINLGTLAVTGAVSATTDGGTDNIGANVTLVNTIALDLGTTSVDGNLLATATAGNLTDNNTVTVTGTAVFITNGEDADIDLGSLAVSSSIDVTTDGGTDNTGADVTLVNTIALDLGTSSVDGNLSATATMGNLTDSNTVTVTGTGSFITSASDADIDLGTLAVTGSIDVTTNGTTGNAAVINATALNFAASTVNGDLTATATTGNLTESGTITVSGAATFTVSASNASVGTSGSALDIAVTGEVTASATTGNGGIFLNQTAGALTLGIITAATGNIEITAAAGVSTTAGDDITGNDITLTLAADQLLSVSATTAITGDGNTTLISDKMDLNVENNAAPADFINAGAAGTLVLRAAENGTALRLGQNAGADSDTGAGTLAIDAFDIVRLGGVSGTIQYGAAASRGAVTIANSGTALLAGSATSVFATTVGFEASGDGINIANTLTVDGTGALSAPDANDSTVEVTATTLTVANSGSIGSVTNRVNFSIDTLIVNSASGDVFATETNGLAFGTVNLGSNNLDVRVLQGNITSATSNGTAGNVTIAVDGTNASIGATGAGNVINVTLSGSLTATASNGNGGIFISETGDMSVASVNAGTGNVELASTTQIQESTTNTTVDITGASVTLTGVTGIGVANATTTNGALDVDTATLTATNATSSGIFLNSVGTGGVAVRANAQTAGGIEVFGSSEEVTLTNLDTANGSITALLTGQVLIATNVVAVGTGQDISLSTTTSGNITLGIVNAADDITVSSAGAIVDATGTITGDVLDLTAGGTIGASGTELTTTVATLTATATDSIFVAESNALILNSSGANAVETTANDGQIQISAGGLLTVNRDVRANGLGNIALSTTGGITSAGGTNGEIVTATGNITLTADDDISLASAVTRTMAGGTLTLQQTTASTSIGVAGATGTVALSTATIGNLSDGFATINIGRSDATGGININAIAFNDPVTFRSPSGGTINVDGTITGNLNASVTIDGSGATTVLSAGITTAGNAITFSDNVIVDAAVTLDTTSGSAAGANVQFDGTIEATSATGAESLAINAGTGGAVTVTGNTGTTEALDSFTITNANQVDLANVRAAIINVTGSNIDLNGATYTAITTAADNDITFIGNVDLDGGGTKTITSGGAAGETITFSALVDGAATLDLVAASGEVNMTGNIGSSTALSSFTVSSAAQVDLEDVIADGAISVTATNIDLNDDTYTSNNDDVTFTGAVDLEFGGTITVTGGGGTGNAITFTAAIEDTSNDDSLTLVGGANGTVDLQSAAGGTNRLAALAISSASQANLNNVTATGSIDVTATAIALNGGTLTAGANDGTNGNDILRLNGTTTLATNVVLSTGTGANGGSDDITLNDVTAGGNNLTVNSADTAMLNGDISATGTGAIAITAARDIAMASGSSIAIVNGNVTLDANQGGTATSGTFNGIDLNNAIITTTGTGNIQLTGRGGDSGTQNYGVNLRGGSSITSSATGATAGTISVSGTGGAGTTDNTGVRIEDSTTDIQSVDGNIAITGTGGAGSGNSNFGVHLVDIETISSTGTGVNAATITIIGTGGAGAALNEGIRAGGSNTDVTSVDGDITITGTGADGSSSQNDGANIQVTIASTTGDIMITGNAGNGTFANRGLVISGSSANISSTSGNITVNGTGNGVGGNNNNQGVQLFSDATIQVGSGTLSVTGTAGTANSRGVILEPSSGGRLIANGGGSIIVTAIGSGTGTDLDAGSDSIIGDGTAVGAANAASGPITINANSIAFADSLNVQSTGALVIQPRTTNTAINLGASATDTGLQLDTAELGFLADGFSSITIGDATNGNGAITVNAVTFNDPVTIAAPASGGSIAVNGQITGSDNASITLDGPGATTTLSADIVTEGNAVTISDSLRVDGARTIRTSGAADNVNGGTVTITGQIDGATDGGTDTLTIDTSNGAGVAATDGSVDLQAAVNGGNSANDLEALTIDAAQIDLANVTVDGNLDIEGTNIDLNGTSYQTTTAGTISFTGPVDLDQASANTTVTIQTPGNTGGQDNISFSAAISTSSPAASNVDLVVNAGTDANVSFGGDVTVESLAANGSTITLGGNVTTEDVSNNNVTITGNVVLSSTITIDTNQTTNDGNIQISGDVDATFGGQQGVTFDAGTGNVTVGGNAGSFRNLRTFIVTAANNISINDVTTNGILGQIDLTAAGTITFVSESELATDGAGPTVSTGDIRIAGNVQIDGNLTLDTDDNGSGTDGTITFVGTPSITSNPANSFGTTFETGTTDLNLTGATFTSLDFVKVGSANNVTLGDLTLGNGANNNTAALQVISSGNLILQGDISTTAEASQAGRVDFTQVGGTISLTDADGTVSISTNSSNATLGTGALTFVEFEQDDVGGVDGIQNARDVAVSPDGNHVYVVGSLDDAIAVFSRNASTGALTFVELERDGVNGVDGLDAALAVDVSPDGRNVYVGGFDDDAVAVFSRDATTGELTFVEQQKDETGGVNGLDGVSDVTVSEDGSHVYVTGEFDDAVAVFSRDFSSGALTFVERLVDGGGGGAGLDAPQSVAVSLDGAHVYVASSTDDSVSVFSRDSSTGALTFVEFERDELAGVDGLDGANSVDVSADGRHVYVTGLNDNSVAVFSRDASTGAIEFVEFLQDGVDGVDGLGGAIFVTVSPDGNQVYTAGETDSAIAVFDRNATTGRLSFVEIQQDESGGVDGLNAVLGLAVSSDGANLYGAGRADNAVAVFSRQAGADAPISIGAGIVDGGTNVALTLDAGSNDVTITGTVGTDGNTIGTLTVTANDIGFTADVDALGITATASQGGDDDSITVGNAVLDARGQEISFAADDITINSSATLQTTGGATNASFQGEALGSTVGLGTGAAGTLNLSESELQTVAGGANGFTNIVIGGNNQTGLITIDDSGGDNTLTLGNTALVINANGTGGAVSQAATGAISLTNSGSGLTINGTGATTTLSANVVTSGGAVNINDSVRVNGAVTIQTSGAADNVDAGLVSITGRIDGANADGTDTLTIDAANAGVDGTGDAVGQRGRR